MAKKNNQNLTIAKKEKNDEFYTQLADIENEIKHYKDNFKNKIVYCNCDDPEWSNFFIYFKNNFNHLGLKKLISTHYSLNIKKNNAYKLECIEYSMDEKGNPKESKSYLKENGDFRNPECIELLIESDIVCTNPPFSLFREYVSQLIEYDKKFLIIGSMNAITYKEIFPLIKENKLWLGVSPRSMEFYKDINKTEKKSVNACWFTNLSHKKRNEEIILWKEYSQEEYSHFDNYNAIEVSKVAHIPKNYNQLLGVPITFLEKYNPNQFEIIGLLADKRDPDEIFIKGKKTYLDDKHKNYVGAVVNGKATYARIIIKHKTI